MWPGGSSVTVAALAVYYQVWSCPVDEETFLTELIGAFYY